MVSIFQPLNKNIELHSGEIVTVFEAKQAGRILGFDFFSDDNLTKIAKDIDLKITWDDENSPAVYCPLADYFGYAFGKPSMKSLLIGSDAGKKLFLLPKCHSISLQRFRIDISR